MTGRTHSVLFFFLIFAFSCSCLSSVPPPAKGSSKGVRLSLGPMLNFYSINTNHAKNPVQKMSALLSFKKEVRLDNEYRAFFLYGIEYFFHGLDFQSYYFKTDTLKLYDKSFAYKYALFIHELDVPLHFKYSFKREHNSQFSPYLMLGYHLRYLLPGHVNITQNGNLVKSDEADVKFRHRLFSDKMNAYISMSLGFQKNNTAGSKKGFFVEMSYRYGFSQYYFEKDYAASSLYMNGTHLSLQLGLKF